MSPEFIDSLKDAARYLLQEGKTRQGLAVQACVTMLEDDTPDDEQPHVVLSNEEIAHIWRRRYLASRGQLLSDPQPRELSDEEITALIDQPDVQDESGILTYYTKDQVIEHMHAALAAARGDKP